MQSLVMNINSTCICGKGLPWIKEEVIMIEPCQHLIHANCITRTRCPICLDKIRSVKRLVDEDKSEYWKYADILAMSCFESKPSYCNTLYAAINTGKLLKILYKIPKSVGIADGFDICREIFDMGYVSIDIKGLSRLPTGPTVYISNHSSYMDFLIMFYVFKCGFLASGFVKKNWIGSKLLDIVPCLVIERGVNRSSVEKIREYLSNGNSLCIFPEGMLTHPKTLIRFRSGAFMSGYQVCPVVIKYKPFIHYNDSLKFVKGVMSGNRIKVEVEILPTSQPPFNEKKIDDIRISMANAGRFILSRVTNRGIKD